MHYAAKGGYLKPEKNIVAKVRKIKLQRIIFTNREKLLTTKIYLILLTCKESNAPK